MHMKDHREVNATLIPDAELNQVTGGMGVQPTIATKYCKNCNAPITQDSIIDSGYTCKKCGHVEGSGLSIT